MKIAMASGKGGTGKTTVSLALALSNKDRALLLDCDVEEPNCHLFLDESVADRQPVMLPIPVIDQEKCTRCGKCARFCQYNALSVSPRAGAMVFTELCHSCGGCKIVCPQGAIREEMVEMGSVTHGRSVHGVELITGRLGIGHASAPSVIRAVQRTAPFEEKEFILMDAPPGTACPFMATVGAADYTLLVTEATPFGLHDLKLAIEALQELKKPCGVIVNRVTSLDNRVSQYCAEVGVPVLMSIPDSRNVAECYARGGTLLDVMPELKGEFRALLETCATLGNSRSES